MTTKIASATIQDFGGGSIAKPSGTVDGDLLVMFSTNTAVRLTTAPAGWTFINSGSSGGLATDTRIDMWYRVASSEPATYAWTNNTTTTRYRLLRITGYGSIANIDAGGNGVHGATSLSVTNTFNVIRKPQWGGSMGDFVVICFSGALAQTILRASVDDGFTLYDQTDNFVTIGYYLQTTGASDQHTYGVSVASADNISALRVHGVGGFNDGWGQLR